MFLNILKMDLDLRHDIKNKPSNLNMMHQDQSVREF